ncbi:neo-calmodulin [Drosophila ficusphila]|uniref:neo-calmodulin n=1 Tax=Drosophila ficusphila TaxID=30025 RepID=UPI0007E7BD8F|nr:neo-calmodulin [Drosophila ficusphila]
MATNFAIAHELSTEQIEELKEAFHRFDLDSNGFLSPKEMRLALLSVGHEITEAELYDFIRSVAPQGEQLTLPRFIQMMAPRMADMNSEENLERTFDLMDRDHDGYINNQDVRATMGLLMGAALSDSDIKDICRAVDMDGDGRISRSDFTSFMRSPI